MYQLHSSLQSASSTSPLTSVLAVYPKVVVDRHQERDLLPKGAERKVVAGCSSTSQCASTALVSLGLGDVVGLNTVCVFKLMLLPRCVLRSRAGGLDLVQPSIPSLVTSLRKVCLAGI